MSEEKQEEVNDKIKLAVIANDISYIKTELKDISDKLEEQYVTKSEFDPIKRIVYGMVSLILIAVVVALLALVIK
jgi:hypothetical protein